MDMFKCTKQFSNIFFAFCEQRKTIRVFNTPHFHHSARRDSATPQIHVNHTNYRHITLISYINIDC